MCAAVSSARAYRIAVKGLNGFGWLGTSCVAWLASPGGEPCAAILVAVSVDTSSNAITRSATVTLLLEGGNTRLPNSTRPLGSGSTPNATIDNLLPNTSAESTPAVLVSNPACGTQLPRCDTFAEGRSTTPNEEGPANPSSWTATVSGPGGPPGSMLSFVTAARDSAGLNTGSLQVWPKCAAKAERSLVSMHGVGSEPAKLAQGS